MITTCLEKSQHKLDREAFYAIPWSVCAKLISGKASSISYPASKYQNEEVFHK